MAYGDYDGPDKPNKGHEGGACNRRLCQAEPAIWFNHGSYSWYCEDCRNAIEFDVVNLANWQLRHQPECGHPMFETREMIDAREASAPHRDIEMVHYVEAAPRYEFPAMRRQYHRDAHRPGDLYRAKKSRR